MQKINYPLIVSDFDGTLRRSDGTVAPETVKSIRRYLAAGGHFCICTGRMKSSILPIARELGLRDLVAAFQGTTILDAVSGEVLFDGGMTAEEAKEVCGVFEEMSLHTHIYDSENVYVNRDDDALKAYEEVCNVKGIVIDKEPLGEFAVKNHMRVSKVIAMVNPEERDFIYERVKARLSDRFNVTYSSVYLVEVTSKAYSKATALKFMAEHFGVPMEKIVAVGDAHNDLPMLEAAGIGFFVKNADEYPSKKARRFPYTNNENAVGRIIEEYGFEKEKL